MAGMPAPQPDPKQQLDAAHTIAPPAANQTTAVADAINSVSPQGIALNAFLNKFNSTVKAAAAPAQKFADGTANVQPIAPRYQPFQFNLSGASPIPADQQAPTITPVAGGFGTLRAHPMTTAVPTAAALIPRDANEAGNLLSAVTGVPAHLMADPVNPGVTANLGPSYAARLATAPSAGGFAPQGAGYDPRTSPVAPAWARPAAAPGALPHDPAPASTDVANTTFLAPNFATTYGKDAPGTLGHTVGAVNALTSPEQHSTPSFLQALHGLTFNQIRTLMPILEPHLAPQEQAYQLLMREEHSKAATEALTQDQAKGLPPGTTRVDPLTGLMRTYAERRAGVSPYSQIYPTQQLDQNGNPVQ